MILLLLQFILLRRQTIVDANAAASVYVIDSQTLVPGGSAVTITTSIAWTVSQNGEVGSITIVPTTEVISLAMGASYILEGGSTQILTPGSAKSLVLDGSTSALGAGGRQYDYREPGFNSGGGDVYCGGCEGGTTYTEQGGSGGTTYIPQGLVTPTLPAATATLVVQDGTMYIEETGKGGTGMSYVEQGGSGGGGSGSGSGSTVVQSLMAGTETFVVQGGTTYIAQTSSGGTGYVAQGSGTQSLAGATATYILQGGTSYIIQSGSTQALTTAGGTHTSTGASSGVGTITSAAILSTASTATKAGSTSATKKSGACRVDVRGLRGAVFAMV